MTPQTLAGGMYIDAWPSGEWVALLPHVGFRSHLGSIAFPAGEGYGLMFPVSTLVGGFRFGGQAHDTLNPAAWEWSAAAGWQSFPPPCGGVWAAIYDDAGTLHRSDLSIGSQGWRYVDASGALITGDATLHDPVSGLFEWTQLPGGIKIGQGQNGGAWVWDGAVRRLLHDGDCFAIRARQVGDQISVAFYTVVGGQSTSLVYRGSLAEFLALPAEVVTPAPAPVPQPPAPVVAPPSPPLPEPPPMFDQNTPSSWTDDQLRAEIAVALNAARSTDDASYWFGVIRQASRGADWPYWAGRIATGDGAGKASAPVPVPVPAPVPTPAPVPPDPQPSILQAALDALSVRVAALEQAPAVVIPPAPDLSKYAIKGGGVTLDAKLPLVGHVVVHGTIDK